jgi:phage terminase large subunit-like protein
LTPSYSERLARLPDDRRERILAAMDADTRREYLREFANWAHDGQLPPRGDWRVWLIMAGRGFGKTRAGAEWITRIARKTGRRRIALVGASLDEVRAVMVEGPSGLLACADRRRPPRWEPSLRRLTYRSGAVVELYSAEAAEKLRGPQHSHAWCDELAKWPNAEAAWTNLMLGLREGTEQRVVVTTTPAPTRLLKRILADPATALTRGRTHDNAHLPAAYVAAVEEAYAGTRLGRQELDGELIEDAEGALWTRAMVEECRLRGESFPRGDDLLIRIVIGVDPPASARGDACGIVACGLTRDGVGIVLEDASVERAHPERWAAAVSACAARWDADRVVAEANNGGEMVRSVLHARDRALPVALVHASHGKSARAEPVAFLYAQGRVKHAEAFPALEDELCGLTAGGGYEGPTRSPDRADALVWALTELMLRRRAEPRILML